VTLSAQVKLRAYSNALGRRGFSIIIVAVQFGSATPAPLFFGLLRQIRIDFFQKPIVAVDPPGSTGTTSLRFGFSPPPEGEKSPVEQAPQGLLLNWKSLKKTDAPPAFPSPTVKKIQRLSLAKRGRAQKAFHNRKVGRAVLSPPSRGAVRTLRPTSWRGSWSQCTTASREDFP